MEHISSGLFRPFIRKIKWHKQLPATTTTTTSEREMDGWNQANHIEIENTRISKFVNCWYRKKILEEDEKKISERENCGNIIIQETRRTIILCI